MLELLKEVCEAMPDFPIAALPVPYRTTPECPTFQSLCCDKDRLYMELEPYLLTRYEMADFARKAKDLGVKWIGGCCGNMGWDEGKRGGSQVQGDGSGN